MELFNGHHLSFANLFSDDFNAVTFSLIGMLIVFGGLTVISLYVALLPKMLAVPAWIRRRGLKSQGGSKGTAAAKEAELMLAIGLALHLDQFSHGANQKITWPRHDEEVSPWQAAGRIRGVAVRSHLPRRQGRNYSSGLDSAE